MIDYKKISKEIRKTILKMMFKSQGSHIGCCLSCVDILTVLYFKILSVDPKRPYLNNRDRFILSKGHAAASLYAALAIRGFFSKNILNDYCMNESKLLGHSTKDSVPGMEVSTGSLGHGLSIGIGMALAAKYNKHNYRVFVLLGDGECDEGSVWEAAMFAGHHKLDNLVAIIDYNKLQAFGMIKDVLNLEPFANKWVSFGWSVEEVNGHDFSELEKTLQKIPFEKKRPSVIIAHTIKGRGVSFMENKLEWHYKSLTQKQYQEAVEEMDRL